MNYLRKFMQKDKKTLSNLAIVFAVGVVLLLTGKMLFPGQAAAVGPPAQGTAAGAAAPAKNTPQPGDYAGALETKLENVYSMIEGAGEVKVMLTLSDTPDGGGLVVNGGGTGANTVKGVVIVAQGAGDEAVRSALIRSTQAVLGIEAYKICVLKMK